MKTITAKFDSKCGKCGSKMVAGSQIRWEAGKVATHVTCPTEGDFQFDITGEMLRTRLAELLALATTRDAVRDDYVLELAGEEPTMPCATCQGTGRVTSKFNMSDTMDFSDWQSFVHPCGTTLHIASTSAGSGWIRGWGNVRVTAEVLPMVGNYEFKSPAYDTRVAAFNAALEAVPLAVQTHYGEGATRWYSWHAPGAPAFNEACVDVARAHRQWSGHVVHAQRFFDKTHPERRGLSQLIALTQSDLEIVRGDVATVLNRKTPFTGVVQFVGEALDFGYNRLTEMPIRVTVLAGGVKKGGALETAVLVSRKATFPVAAQVLTAQQKADKADAEEYDRNN